MRGVLWIALLLLSALPGVAQGRLDVVAAGVDRAITPAAEPAALERMARLLGTSPEALRAVRASTRLGWGDVFIAHRIATRGGHPVEKVLAARRTGAAWGQIAEEARVEPDALVHDVGALWPDAARATPDGDPAEATKTLGGRILDVLRGAPDRTDESTRQDRPTDRTQEEIRDRMIRGGGRSR